MAKPKNTKPDKGMLVMILGVIGAVVALVFIIRGPARVKQVTVSYTAMAEQQARKDGYSDDDFIRQSQVTNKKMRDMNTWEQTAADSIAAMGTYELTSVKKTSRTSIEMQINARTPIAVVKTGGWYFTIDSEQNIVERNSSFAEGSYIFINGVTLKNPNVGQTASGTGTDDRLENALEIVKLLYTNNWQSRFTNIYMLENKDVWLYSTYKIPINVSLWYKDTLQGDLAAAIYVLDEKGRASLSGEITAVNGHVYWDEDADDFQQIKGQ